MAQMEQTAAAGTESRFPAGTFAPAPRRASMSALVFAQAKMESILFLRHGEQLLLSMVIPIAMLIGVNYLPFINLDDGLRRSFPMVLAVAVMSAGFTGQAIAVAFDRRYGALKRMGASALPRWTIIVGKICAVVVTVAIQTIVLGSIALILGLTVSPLDILCIVVFLLVGTATFTALGLLLGGTLGSELVLALANLVWFALMGCAAIVMMEPSIPEGPHSLMMLIPSVALTEGFIQALHGSFDVFAAVVLAAWAAVGSWAATKLFSFTA